MDLNRYIIRTSSGIPLIQNTVDKFRDQILYCCYLVRRDGFLDINLITEDMMNIDWSSKIDGWVSDNGGYDALSDKARLTAVINKFSKYLTDHVQEWAKAAEESEKRSSNRRKNIFEAYKQLDTHIAPQPEVVMAVCLVSGVKPSESKNEQAAIAEEIEKMMSEQILGVILGPSGGLCLCKDSAGKETMTFRNTPTSKIHFERIKRARKNKDGKTEETD